MASVLISLAITTHALAAMPADSRWSDDYGYSLKMARLAQHPLLVVLDKPTEEKQRVRPARFSLDRTQAALLRPYQLCHVDVTTAYGQKVAKAFGATRFPLTAIFDKTGQAIIYKKTGRFRTDEWVSVLVAHHDGLRRADCFT